MLAWWGEFSQRPTVAHLMRAIERFNVRGGVQFAAAVTYFSVLAIVPILMLAFSVLGLFITVLRPESLVAIETWITDRLQPDDPLGGQLVSVITEALTNWASIGLVGLGLTMWIGSGWVGNIKRAVRVLMRTNVDDPGKQLILPLDVLANFAGLVGLLLGIAATFVAATTATSLGSWVGALVGIDGSLGWSLLLRLMSVVVALAAGTALFRLLFAWFSPVFVPARLAWIGSGLGAAGLLVLQALTGYLIGMFSRNLSAQLFGPLIVLMLFLNLFATLILLIAAWLATAVVSVPEPEATVVDPVLAEPVERRPGELQVSSAVAQRSLGAGLTVGYAVGAATGLGVGALLVGGLKALFGRRP